jgi:tryptophan-rich hypothetical protein
MVIQTIRLLDFSSIFFVRGWAVSFQTEFMTADEQNHLNPEKLLLRKWTAVEPRDKEKHFLVVRVINPEAPTHKIQEVEMEAVMTRRRFLLRWEELTDATKWVQGWV